MRFLIIFTCGAFCMTAAATTVCNTCFEPSVESFPEFRQVSAEKVALEHENDKLRRRLTELELDTIRRAHRDPINPNGKAVPVEDRIPALKELFPIPVPMPPELRPAGGTE